MFVDMGMDVPSSRARVARSRSGWRDVMPAGLYRAWLVETEDGADRQPAAG